jgi:hypothetical protein
MTWRTYAHRCPRRDTGIYYSDFGSLSYVKAHGLKDPIVLIELTEAPEDASDEVVYWGWVDHGIEDGSFKRPPRYEDGKPEMIWYSWNSFSVCFTYGQKQKPNEAEVI